MRRAEGEMRIGSANDPLSQFALWVIVGIALALAFSIYHSSYKTIIFITIGIAILCTAYAALRLMASIIVKPTYEFDEEQNSPLTWPFYTVMVPIFHEAHMVEELISGLEGLDYPTDRLEILMICEEIDPFTIAMVEKYLKPPFSLIIVPKGTPQTKPRALNYALNHAQGDIITIYDAEDIPRPNQLKKAATAFLNNSRLGALQAPLDYRNSNQNWLTRQFSLEYSALFHVWIPFLVTLKLPFPLGGTSNHVRFSALADTDVKGWDSYNVTEDADLAFRLAAKGWEFGFIDCPTDEEAVCSWKSWIFQRSRWMKGFLQTWIVHMRLPFKPRGLLGLKRFFVLQLTIGLTLLNAFFHLPIVLIMTYFVVRQFIEPGPIYIPFPFIVSLCISYVAGILIGVIGAYRAGKMRLMASAIWMPLYWWALFFPAIHALWELGRKPFFWHKTHHGVRGRINNPNNQNTNSNYDAFG